jgi:hypothetical protein
MSVLGKDCLIEGGGISNDAVRDVAVSYSSKTIESSPFGQRGVASYPVGWDCTLEIELIEDPQLYDNLIEGTAVNITGQYGGRYIVAGITRNEPLDDVVTVRVTLKTALPA